MRPNPTLVASALLAGALLAHGCAPVSSAAMVPENVRIERSLGGAVRVEAFGTPRQAWIGRSLVSGDELSRAVQQTVLEAGLFEEVSQLGKADRVLTVQIERLDEPGVGIDQTCEVAMRWTLTSGDRSRTIWEELITTRKTVTSYDEIDSSLRAELAVQGALEANLRRATMRLSNEG